MGGEIGDSTGVLVLVQSGVSIQKLRTVVLDYGELLAQLVYLTSGCRPWFGGSRVFPPNLYACNKYWSSTDRRYRRSSVRRSSWRVERDRED